MPVYTPYTPMYQPYSNYHLYPQSSIPQPPQMIQQPSPQQPQQTQPVPQSSILWVRNSQDAAMYPVAPNNAVALWDSGAPVIYLKQADASGKPSMKTYDLVERSERPSEATNDDVGKVEGYATKTELAALAWVVKDVDGVIAAIREDVDALKGKTAKKSKAKTEDEDDG